MLLKTLKKQSYSYKNKITFCLIKFAEIIKNIYKEVLLKAENHKIQPGLSRTIFENRPDFRILIHGKVL